MKATVKSAARITMVVVLVAFAWLLALRVRIAEDMVERIDVFAMPNFANVDDKWRGVYWDPKHEYSAP